MVTGMVRITERRAHGLRAHRRRDGVRGIGGAVDDGGAQRQHHDDREHGIADEGRRERRKIVSHSRPLSDFKNKTLGAMIETCCQNFVK